MVANIKKLFESKGYLFFVTINPNPTFFDGELATEEIDYSMIADVINNITFLQFVWGTNYGPPAPSNSIEKIRTHIEYVIPKIPPNKITIGYSLISYDWKLPYIPGKSFANSLSITSSLNLARNEDATIQFDDVSQSPFFLYQIFDYTYKVINRHIVWSIDARSISALLLQ